MKFIQFPKMFRNSETKIVMISGHMKITEEQFNEYYKPKIDYYSELEYNFITGGANGVDEMTQHYIAKNHPNRNLCIYDKGDQYNLYYNYQNFNHINGFSSYEERDKFMTHISDIDIAFINKKGYISSTTKNLIRRKYGSEIANDIINILKSNAMED